MGSETFWERDSERLEAKWMTKQEQYQNIADIALELRAETPFEALPRQFPLKIMPFSTGLTRKGNAVPTNK